MPARSQKKKKKTGIQTFYAKGKLLLTGEYLVLDGANALAVPSLYGQSLEIKRGRGSEIKWKSLDKEGQEWFKAVISLFDLKCEKSSNEEIGHTLSDVLNEAVRLNSDFLSSWYGFSIVSKCEFPLTWGLGSSSTLVYCIARWADVDPFELYDRTFNGSGYDIACADAEGPIRFQRTDGEFKVEPASFNPSCKDSIYFIHTGHKVNSREQIAHYNETKSKVSSSDIDTVSEITDSLVKSRALDDVNKLLSEHEKLLSKILRQPPVQESIFKDYWGTVKSLGAWGGDFVLATSDREEVETRAYFSSKGMNTVLKWDELVFSK